MDLQAKTYLRGLFANDPLSPNFEALWTNLTPTYASQYPALRSLPLLIGYATGLGAWGGVLLTVALMPLAVLWMTRQWLGPGYALVAALLVTLRFGLFSHWANSYFGAHVAALGGVLLVGGYKVLRSRPNLLGGAAFGAGAVLIMMTRPYEGLWFATPLAAAVAGDFLRSDRTLRAALVAPALVAAVLAAGGVGLTAASNQAITGDWKLFPNVLQREEMGTAPLLLVQTWRPPASDRTRYDWLRRNMEHEKVQYLRRNSARDVVVAEGERFANSWTFYLGFSLILPFVLGLWPLRREPALVLAAGLLGVGLALETFELGALCGAGFRLHHAVGHAGLPKSATMGAAGSPIRSGAQPDAAPCARRRSGGSAERGGVRFPALSELGGQRLEHVVLLAVAPLASFGGECEACATRRTQPCDRGHRTAMALRRGPDRQRRGSRRGQDDLDQRGP